MHPLDSDIRSRLLSAHLPVMPQILLKLIEHCQDDDAGINVLADLIAKDPGITSKVLGIANSSAYHRQGRSLGLDPALAALGTDMIKTLVINESVFQVFNNLSQANGTDLRAFWKHSLTVAALAKDIAEKLRGVNPEEAYLAGLLHDVGRLALLTAADKEFAFIFFAHDDDKLSNIEHSLLHLTHTEAGAILADRWNLDSFLADSLLYHHLSVTNVENAHPLVRYVILSHLISIRADDDPSLLATATACGFPPADIAGLRARSQTKVQGYAEALGIDLAGADDLVVPTDGWEIAGRLASLEEGNAAPKDLTAEATPLAPQEAVRRALVEEVRNVVLTSELRHTLTQLPGQESASRDAIIRSARILFELNDVIIFTKNAAGDALYGTPASEHSQRMKEFSIRLDGHSRLSQAARSAQVYFAERTPEHRDLAESQLMRLFECDGLVGVPIKHGDDYIGMLIGGTGARQIPGLKNRERFLRSFGTQAAVALQTTDKVSVPAATGAPAVTRLPRKIVHESNNALSIIKNYLSVLDGKLEKQQIAAKEIAILHEEVDRVGRIINAIGNDDSTEPPVTDVDRSIGKVVRLYRDTAPSPNTTKVIAELQESACEIACPPETLKQILINLIKNAIEATPEHGEIRVANKGFINRDGQLYVELRVEDNGPGIPRPILANLFSPVSTTKGEAHQGIGLHIVHDLVKQYHGLISCRSNATGTAFEILFPAHPRAARSFS